MHAVPVPVNIWITRPPVCKASLIVVPCRCCSTTVQTSGCCAPAPWSQGRYHCTDAATTQQTQQCEKRVDIAFSAVHSGSGSTWISKWVLSIIFRPFSKKNGFCTSVLTVKSKSQETESIVRASMWSAASTCRRLQCWASIAESSAPAEGQNAQEQGSQRAH